MRKHWNILVENVSKIYKLRHFSKYFSKLFNLSSN